MLMEMMMGNSLYMLNMKQVKRGARDRDPAALEVNFATGRYL